MQYRECLVFILLILNSVLSARRHRQRQSGNSLDFGKDIRRLRSRYRVWLEHQRRPVKRLRANQKIKVGWRPFVRGPYVSSDSKAPLWKTERRQTSTQTAHSRRALRELFMSGELVRTDHKLPPRRNKTPIIEEYRTSTTTTIMAAAAVRKDEKAISGRPDQPAIIVKQRKNSRDLNISPHLSRSAMLSVGALIIAFFTFII